MSRVALVLLSMLLLTQTETLYGLAGQATSTYTIDLPLIATTPIPPSILGIDLRVSAPNGAEAYAHELGSWIRAGDMNWDQVEATQGTYQWSVMAGFDANVARIRAIGGEPTAIMMRTPLWATAIDGRVCAPPSDQAIDDFERFAEAAARRYTGALRIDIWQVGNEVDFHPNRVEDNFGSGCWGTDIAPYYGGDHYGEVLMRVAAAIRRGNPQARIIAGGLAYPNDQQEQTLGFVHGILASGAAHSFNWLSYTGYGNQGINDMMVLRAARLREVFQANGYPNIALISAELGLTCTNAFQCPSDFQTLQAAYASRIVAEAIAADLSTISWYTTSLAAANDPYEHRIVDNQNGTLVPRPAFYALRNTVDILEGAVSATGRFTGFPNQQGSVMLSFTKGGKQIYVVWDPYRNGAAVWLPIASGSQVTCISQLQQPTPTTIDCSNQVRDGLLSLNVIDPVIIQIVP
jgi:hypothetical protein